MGSKELFDNRNDFVSSVLENIVPTIVKGVDLRIREATLPLFGKMMVKHEVLHPPADRHRQFVETLKAGLHIADDGIARVFRFEWDVLDEAQGGDPVFG